MERPAYATGAIEVDFSRVLIEKHNGIARMQKTETNKRLAILLSSIKSTADGRSRSSSGGLYQDLAVALVCDAVHQRKLLANIVSLAEDAADLNQVSSIAAIGDLLLKVAPSPSLASVGAYYKGLANLRSGATSEGRATIEKVFATLPPAFKTKALLALSSCC